MSNENQENQNKNQDKHDYKHDEHSHNKRYNILIGGKAGQGINELANIIAASLVNAGFYVFNYRDYQSLITGGHNFNVVTFSQQPLYSNDEHYADIFIALDKNSYYIHKDKFDSNTIIATNTKELDANIHNLIFIDTSAFGKASNMVFAGFVLKILGLDKSFLIQEIDRKFKDKPIYEKDIEAANFGYEKDYGINLNLKATEKKGSIYSGSEAIAKGAIDAGVEIYFGYPMTPSTPVLTLLALEQKNNPNLKVFSPENEIAVIQASAGASFAGKRVMTGTSGGGFDLMSETLSMIGCMELPLVIHLAQRTGPSSGVPTYTAQSDLNVALYAGHGDFNRIVIAPGDAKEAYEKTIEAFYLAEKLNTPVILLTDKHLVESQYTQTITKPAIVIPKRDIKLGKEIIKRNSYEHDINWNTTEDYLVIKESATRRVELRNKIYDLCTQFKMFEHYGNPDAPNLLISFGSTKGAVLDALKSLPDFRYIHVSYVMPLNKDIIKEIVRSENVFVIEGNSTGQFADYIQKQFALPIPQKNRILRYDSLPFTPKYIIDEVKKRLSS